MYLIGRINYHVTIVTNGRANRRGQLKGKPIPLISIFLKNDKLSSCIHTRYLSDEQYSFYGTCGASSFRVTSSFRPMSVIRKSSSPPPPAVAEPIIVDRDDRYYTDGSERADICRSPNKTASNKNVGSPALRDKPPGSGL